MLNETLKTLFTNKSACELFEATMTSPFAFAISKATNTEINMQRKSPCCASNFSIQCLCNQKCWQSFRKTAASNYLVLFEFFFGRGEEGGGGAQRLPGQDKLAAIEAGAAHTNCAVRINRGIIMRSSMCLRCLIIDHRLLCP